jgi:hypothetical protein
MARWSSLCAHTPINAEILALVDQGHSSFQIHVRVLFRSLVSMIPMWLGFTRRIEFPKLDEK